MIHFEDQYDLVVIDDNKEIVRKSAQQIYKGIREQQIRGREFAIYTVREDILRQIELLEGAGIQYLIVQFEPSRELEACIADLDHDMEQKTYQKQFCMTTNPAGFVILEHFLV